MNEDSNINMPAELNTSQLMNVDQSIAIDDNDFVKEALKRLDRVNTIKSLTLSNTNKKDWVAFGENAYLNIGGCQKVARIFGLSWKIMENRKITEAEGHYFYLVKADFWPSQNEKEKIDEMGTRGTKDKFFGTVGGKQKPPAEIDETNIQKAAVTNCLNRGIKSILGLGNITWDEINAYMKPDKQINQNNVASVTYNTGSQGGSQAGSKITEKQGGRLYAISKAHNITDDQMKDYLLTNYDIDHDPKNKDSFLQITRGKMYDDICKWANAQ